VVTRRVAASAEAKRTSLDPIPNAGRMALLMGQPPIWWAWPSSSNTRPLPRPAMEHPTSALPKNCNGPI